MKKNNIKKSFINQRFRSGMYSSVLIAIVFVAVVLLNLVFAKLNITQDLSENGLFTLSKDTIQVLKDMKQDVTLYYMVTDGQEEPYIEEVMKNYEKYGKHIKIVKRDPVTYQSFVAEYSQTSVQNNDVLVVNDSTDTAKHVLASEMCYQDTSAYYTTGNVENVLDTEGQLTSAILNVTSEAKIKLYILSGHEEISVGDGLEKTLNKRNIETEELILKEGEEVPEDCDVLLINGPGVDLVEDEVKTLETYLDKGGKAVVFADNFKIKVPNFEKFLQYYGISLVEGQVIDPESYNYYVNYVVPQTVADHDIVNGLSGKMTMMNSQALQQMDDARATLKFTPLLTTSDSAYSRTDFQITDIKQQDSDIAGPFTLGYAISERKDDATMQMAVFGSHYVIMDDVIQIAPANQDVFINAITWMADVEIPQVSIASKSPSSSTITVTQSNALLWAAIMIVIIPGGLLLAGFGIWWVRRKS